MDLHGQANSKEEINILPTWFPACCGYTRHIRSQPCGSSHTPHFTTESEPKRIFPEQDSILGPVRSLSHGPTYIDMYDVISANGELFCQLKGCLVLITRINEAAAARTHTTSHPNTYYI